MISNFVGKPKRILVFNPLKRLIAIFQSSTAAARAFGIKPNTISCACSGELIACHNLYFRHLQDDIEVTFDDFGTLRVEEYDKLCGVERRYYKTKRMDRTGMKYNKKKKEENES